MNHDQRTARRRAIADSAFRVLGSLIFVTAGWGHLVRPEAIVARLEASAIGAFIASIAPANVLVIATGVAMLVAGLALLLGAATRSAALVLMACLVPITISVQLAPGQAGPLFKNIALLGMLLHFASAGAAQHALSVDRIWARRRRGATAPSVTGVTS